MQTENRRSFVTKAGAIAAGSFLNLNPLAKGANERVTLALIGGRSQGRNVAMRVVQQGGQIKTLCDIDDAVLASTGAEIGKAQNRQPDSVKDFRRVLEDKSIDAVIIGAPDHWHARMMVLACQAGKDVYVEKPLSHTIHEGHVMREAAKRYNRIVQVGTQRRSGAHFRSAVEYAASGKLGKLCMIKAWMCQVRPSIGNPPDAAVPSGVDYDMWLGPAPQRPFNANRFHYNWRFFWDYCNSELGNQGVHMLDVAIAAVQATRGLDHCLPKRISSNGGIYWLDDAKEVPDTQVVTYDYGDLLMVWELRSFGRHYPSDGSTNGTSFLGSDASLVVDDKGWRVFSKDSREKPVMSVERGENESVVHARNFLECVKSRKQPNAPVEIGRLSTTLSHLGNISHHLRRDIQFDAKTETFGADKAANAYLTKKYRKSYDLPSV